MLDEMVGLGILKRHKSQNHSIRSHNLIKLLGNEEQIEASFVGSNKFASSKTL